MKHRSRNFIKQVSSTILLLVCITAAVVGCKKDSSEIVKMNDNLIGEWLVQSNKIIYYDQSGQKEYEDVIVGPSTLTQISFMKGLKAKIVTRDAEVLNSRYNLAEENQQIYIELYEAAIFEAQVWKIMEAEKTEMTWNVNFTNIKYEDKETGEIIEAPKATLTLKFKKQ